MQLPNNNKTPKGNRKFRVPELPWGCTPILALGLLVVISAVGYALWGWFGGCISAIIFALALFFIAVYSFAPPDPPEGPYG